MNNAGELNTRVRFFEYASMPGPEPGEREVNVIWECWAEVYEPSTKDFAVLSTTGVEFAVTVRIRDTRGEFRPFNKHYLAVLDDAYTDDEGEYIRFNIKKVQPDIKNKKFVKIVAEASR